MSERLNKTSICSVVFLDIVDQSKKPVAEQIKDKELFNDFINEAIKDVAQNDRILLDTGDGAAIALLGAPEEALFVAMTIRDNIVKYNQENNAKLLVRTGINLGPVRVVSDINGRPNILGDGINVAERVMSFSEANQILVSRSYYEITSRLTEEITGMFAYFGVKQDKHIREHEVYVIRSSGEAAAATAAEEPAAQPAAVATLVSRIMDNESLQKYGLWASAALVVLAISIGGFMLAGNLFAPDIGDVVAGAEAPASTAAALEVPPALDPKAQPVSAEARMAAAEEKVTSNTKPGTKKAATGTPATTAKADTRADAPKRKATASKKKKEPVEQAAPRQESTVAAAQPVESGVAQEEPGAASGESKTGWSAFKESFKQGREERICTQAEITLNQCK